MRPRPRMVWRFHVLPMLAALLALVGIAIASYPPMAQWFSQYKQSKVVNSYSTAVATGLDPSSEEQFTEAREYNEALSVGALLEANANVPRGVGNEDQGGFDYDSLLNVGDTGLMGRIKIPAINADLPIYHGTSDETLLKGIGHLKGTSLPVGGIGTRAVLTGHRGLADAELFTKLNKVVVGDEITLEILDQALSYRVTEIKVVEPEDTEELQAVPGRDLVTLVTCTPLGINTQRILVTGERVLPTPPETIEDLGAQAKNPGFPWWAIIQAAGFLLAAAYIWRSGRQPEEGPPAA
ncbi:class C sortase [Schaalia cardiffensis]|nr:class C sortase [Schaalia cardiffensis]